MASGKVLSQWISLRNIFQVQRYLRDYISHTVSAPFVKHRKLSDTVVIKAPELKNISVVMLQFQMLYHETNLLWSLFGINSKRMALYRAHNV